MSTKTWKSGLFPVTGPIGRLGENAESVIWLVSHTASFVGGHNIAMGVGYVAQ